MMNKEIFTKIAKRIRRSGGLQNPRIVYPIREWVLGIFITIFLFVATVMWSMYNYTKYDNISIENSSDIDTEVIVYRESLVNSTLQKFSERRTEHEKLLNDIELNQYVEKEIPIEVPTESADNIEEEILMDTSSDDTEEIIINDSETN